jgi:tetratricopeptide (TPR) repeat protein
MRYLALFISILFSFCSFAQQKPNKFLDNGKKLLDEGKYEQALTEFNSAIKANGKEAEAYYYRGRTNLFLEKPQDAKKDITKATELDPKKGSYFNLLGIVAETLNDSTSAFTNYNKALALDSNDFKPLVNLAKLYEEKEQYKTAIKYMNLALKRGPKDADNHYSKGSILEGMKDTVGAMKCYETALSLDSNFVSAAYGLAYLHNAKNNFKMALKYANRAIAVDPKNSNAYIEKGKAYEALKDSAMALVNYSKAIEADPKNSMAYFSRGTLYNNLNKKTAAIKDFSKMLEIDNKDVDALMARSECYADTDNYVAAIADLELAKKINPEDAFIYFSLGNTQDQGRYFREAIESYNIAIKLDSTNSDYYYSRGNSRYNLEETEGAKKDYNKALKLDSSNTAPLFNLGNIYFDAKNYEEALKYYDLYLKSNTKDSDAYVNRGICKKAMGGDKEACEDWNKAAALGNAEAKQNITKFCPK